MSDKLREAAQALWHAIDQEYDVDDGIPNFSSDIGLAYTELGTVLKSPARAEPVLDRRVIDILHAIVHADDAMREAGTLMPFQGRIALNWAADHAEIVIRNHANWIKEHGHGQIAEPAGEHETDDGGGGAEPGPA